MVVALTLAGCALQQPASTSLRFLPAQWVEAQVVAPAPAASTANGALGADWWKALDDSALDDLIAAAETDSPTLASALARVQEARAKTAASEAAAAPSVTADSNFTRGNSVSGGQLTGSSPPVQSTTSATLNLSWEFDLFGRLAHDSAAARARLQASIQDAASTRLALEAQIADRVASIRACILKLSSREDDVRSRTVALRMTVARQSVGQVSSPDSARALSNLAAAEVDLATLRAEYRQEIQSLVALSGRSAAQIDALLLEHSSAIIGESQVPPYRAIALPATVLARHPSVLSALRSADAAYEDVGSARAARWPSISLSALLGSTWLHAAGLATSSATWSLEPGISLTLFDGGAGRSKVEAARARHAQAMATLESAVRSAIQDVENALSQLQGAEQRVMFAQAQEAAARRLLAGSQAGVGVGRASLFELEDARRSFNDARIARIDAQRDRAQAWIALVKSTGNPAGLSISSPA